MSFGLMSFRLLSFGVPYCWCINQRKEYQLDGSRLDTTVCERGIGVLISNNLKPSQQCKKAAQTASTVLARITRAVNYRDKYVCKILKQQYVRPHLEFAVATYLLYLVCSPRRPHVEPWRGRSSPCGSRCSPCAPCWSPRQRSPRCPCGLRRVS